MVEGISGVFACTRHAGLAAHYEPSKRRVTFSSDKGLLAVATTFSAEEPDLLCGPEHDLAWSDELASWKTSKPGGKARNRAWEAWDNLQFGLRLISTHATSS